MLLKSRKPYRYILSKWAVMYLCACHIDVSYFYDFYVGFLNCSDYNTIGAIMLTFVVPNAVNWFYVPYFNGNGQLLFLDNFQIDFQCLWEMCALYNCYVHGK